jgi:transcriptional regulator with XRE-family HTH domain
MSLRTRLKRQLRNKEFRHAYADEQLNLSISTQIKVIREKQKMKQAELAHKIGTKQAGISRIESANYDGWSIALLRRLAEAFDLRLRVSFEEFGALWQEVDTFSRESLERRQFDEDPEFEEATAASQATVGSRSNVVPIDTPLWRVGNALDNFHAARQEVERLPMGAAAASMMGEMRA